MNGEEIFMQRCLELASNALGSVAPNPMVGCVIVHDGTIIGEGFHREFGKEHAEVNAIRSVIEKHGEEILKKATLYVSLEPCVHYGKTPPCADLIIEKKITNVFVGCRDPFIQVNGKGIEKLRTAGVTVHAGLLEQQCRELNKRFLTFQEQKRPYIILKFAQSKDGFIASSNAKSWISNEYSRKLVHKWRGEEQAIMVGTNTVLIDDPRLTVREWKRKNPARIILDRTLKIPLTQKVFNEDAPTIIFNETRNEKHNNISWIKIDFDKNPLPEILHQLWSRNIQSVLVEGGAKLLQSFIEQDLWDEARIFIGNKWLGEGLKAPSIRDVIIEEKEILNDKLIFMRRDTVVD